MRHPLADDASWRFMFGLFVLGAVGYDGDQDSADPHLADLIRGISDRRRAKAPTRFHSYAVYLVVASSDSSHQPSAGCYKQRRDGSVTNKPARTKRVRGKPRRGKRRHINAYISSTPECRARFCRLHWLLKWGCGARSTVGDNRRQRHAIKRGVAPTLFASSRVEPCG